MASYLLGSVASLLRLPASRAEWLRWLPWIAGAVDFVVGGAAVGLIANSNPWSLTLAATAVVAGRQWPMFGSAQGSKGLWAAGGALSAITPLAVPVGAVLWAIGFVGSGYRSAGIVAAIVLLPVALGATAGWSFGLMAIPVCVLCFERQRADLARLMAGTEPKHHWRPDA